MKCNIIILLLAAITIVGCRQVSKQSTESEQPTKDANVASTTNAIYHWKTTFAPDTQEWEFLRRHNIKRLYIRMFDVVAEHNRTTDNLDIVPNATTEFGNINHKNIEGVEIIPTTYITLEALREMQGKEQEYAVLLVERLRAMANYNKLGKIREMQFDCDWTESTRKTYFKLCSSARNLLKADTIALSSTIRLHQLSQEAPPVDRGVLMIYNTGALKNPKTKNSILDIEDVKPYVKKMEYPLPLDYAYPTFGWGVKFYRGEFREIVSNPQVDSLQYGEIIREERPTVEEVLEVKKLVEKQLGKPSQSNIIYHFNKEQLKHYSDNEISQIFSAN